MLKLCEGTKIYVADIPVDMRKAINSLAVLVEDYFKNPVNDGSVYFFCNRAYDRVKCLFWDRNRFVHYHKRLEHGKFKLGKQIPTPDSITSHFTYTGNLK